jgi:RecA-family ATPase
MAVDLGVFERQKSVLDQQQLQAAHIEEMDRFESVTSRTRPSRADIHPIQLMPEFQVGSSAKRTPFIICIHCTSITT